MVMNFICVMRMVVSDVVEVMVVMYGEISDIYCFVYCGIKVRKMYMSRRDIFRSINDVFIVKVWLDGKIEYLRDDYRKRGEGEVEVDDKFEEKVVIFKIYLGVISEFFEFFVDRGYKGIVIEGMGFGYMLNDMIFVIERVVENGVVVCVMG